MRLVDRYGTQTEIDVDLERCEQADPCAYDHTCRIHRLYGFLKRAGYIAQRTSLDDGPPAPQFKWGEPWVPPCLWPQHPLGCKCNWETLRTARPARPALPPIWAWRREPGETLWADTNSMVNHSHIEVEDGALWLLDTCPWCAVGNPRLRSSVTDCFVHTDTPVGRKVCSGWKVGGLVGTSWYLTGDPRQIPAGRHFLPEGFASDHCFWCGGTGRVMASDPGEAGQSNPCPRCEGTGHLPDPPPSFPRECEFGRID